MKKKALLVLLILLIATLGICNWRVPFFKTVNGPWSVAYGKSKDMPWNLFIDKKNLYSPEKLKANVPNTQFLADPFFFYENGSYYLFFEHKLEKINHAHISLLESSDGINYTYSGPVLKEDFHLSYPQVFKHNGDFYMLPETQGGNNVILYKAHNFPLGWKAYDTLIHKKKFKDPTLFLSDTLNLMAVTDNNLTMHLYHADSLNGEWKLHQQPLMLMGSESRPGGRFFRDGKDLILPVQNNSKSYGSGLSLYRMTFKNGTYTLKVEKDLFLKAQQDIPEFGQGMHHIDIQPHPDGYYYVYDGNRTKDVPSQFNPIYSLKINFYDLKNWFYQKLAN